MFLQRQKMPVKRNIADLHLKENGENVILSVREVCKTYHNGGCDTVAVNHVSFDVYEGELLLILGESGCGKTSLLNILGGMDRSDSGTVLFRSLNLSRATEAQLTNYRRFNVGFVFQNYNLMPNLTVKNNLEIISELVYCSDKAEDVLALVGMKDKKDSYPSQLSGGQQQRVSIARALIKKPKLLLADEPTAALDYKTGVEVLRVFEKIRQQRTTVIMISHNNEIAKMADRILKMKDGSIVEIIKNPSPLSAEALEW